MRRNDQLCFFRNEKIFRVINLEGLKIFKLFIEKSYYIQHYSITDNVFDLFMEYARRYLVQDNFMSIKFQCVTCIRSALETGYYLIFRGKYIYDLTFTFVTPL